jgi:hypothetical protein
MLSATAVYGQVDGCLSLSARDGSVPRARPIGEDSRPRPGARGRGVVEGLSMLVAELTFEYGFPSARYERSVSSESVSLEVLAPLE